MAVFREPGMGGNFGASARAPFMERTVQWMLDRSEDLGSMLQLSQLTNEEPGGPREG